MDYAEFKTLATKSLSRMNVLAQTDAIMEVLLDYADMVPRLPFRALLRIRDKGFVSVTDLHTILTQQGFTISMVDEFDAKNITRFQKEVLPDPGRAIHPNELVVTNAQAWIYKFKHYIGRDWRSGRVLKRFQVPVDQVPVSAVQTVVTKDDKTDAWIEEQTKLYSGWVSPAQVRAAQQTFLTMNPDFRAVADEEIVKIVQSGWKDGTIKEDTSVKEITRLLVAHYKVIRTHGAPAKGVFYIFTTGNQLESLFFRVLEMKFTAARRGFFAHHQKIEEKKAAKEKAAKPKRVLVLDITHQTDAAIDTIITVARAFGVDV